MAVSLRQATPGRLAAHRFFSHARHVVVGNAKCGVAAARRLRSWAVAQAVAAPPAARPPTQAACTPGRPGDMDYTTLAAAMNELQLLCPAKCEQAVQIAADMLALRLRNTPSSHYHLYLSWQQHGAAITMNGPPAARGAASEAFSFGEQVQAALRGQVLMSVTLPAVRWERVVCLSFAERLGEPVAHSLYHEVQGRYSNLILTNGQGTILAAGHQVGGKQSSLRQVQVGGAYQLPPPGPGLDPDAVPSAADWQQVVQQAAEQGAGKGAALLGGCLVRAFRGVSPSLAQELCSLASISADASPALLTAEQWSSLWRQWQQWLERVESGRFAASSCPETGQVSVLGSYSQPAPSLLDVLHTRYSAAKDLGEFQALKQQLQQAVAAAVQRQQRKVQSLRRQGGQEGKHLEVSKLADLLMANVHRWKPGMQELEVEDWDAPGTLVRVTVEDGKTAVEQATKLYKQAGKQRRAVEATAPLIEQAQQAVMFLQEVALQLEQLDQPGDLQALREMRMDLVEAGFMRVPRDAVLAQKAASKAKRATRRAQQEAGDSAGFRRFATPVGRLVVLVGRNSRQNDMLSTKMVQPADLWFHARGVPGAHVLLRVPAGKTADDADIQFAADLAAYYSKARTETKADVTMCRNPSKNITKFQGARLGQVLVRKEEVVIGRPDRSVAAAEGADR